MTRSGKYIPVDYFTGEPHNCMLAQVKKDIQSLKR
jgi:hypothetical protein